VSEQASIRVDISAYAMNASTISLRRKLLRGACGCVLFLAGFIASATAAEDVDPTKVYKIVYGATLDPKTGLANVTVTIEQPRSLLRSLELVMPSKRYLNIRASSDIEVDGDRITWRPNKKGGELKFDFVIANKRSNGAEDSRIDDTWALLKLDKLFPPASARVVKGASSKAVLELVAPKGWVIETPYGRVADDELAVTDPDRLFDSPAGWMIAGKLGVRRDDVGERIVRVASPLGSNPRAADVLTFVRFNLPALIEVFPDFPQYLLIVSGSQDMWRGGLSGRGSLYMHPSRPLVSGNRTSPMLHELVHIASRFYAQAGADWIVEGIAEYYSIELLLRTGGISQARYNESFKTLEQWSAGVKCLATDRSQGKQTARAVLVMRALDTEIRAASKGKASLDTLVQKLMSNGRAISNADFRAAATQLTNSQAKALAGCP
jgi:predicted metalloprotease with PDZ domain